MQGFECPGWQKVCKTVDVYAIINYNRINTLSRAGERLGSVNLQQSAGKARY